MVIVSEVGSLCNIQIRGKYPLFSASDFDQILSKVGFERKIDTQNNNYPYYQKGESIIFNNPTQHTIILKLSNTISIQTKYLEFSTVLAKLRFKPESIAMLGGQFTTFVTNVGNTQSFLDKFLNQNAQTALSDKLKINPTVLSIVIANKAITDVDLQLRLEPLNSSPEDSLYVDMVFRTTNYENFNEFISKFDANFIREIIDSISEVK